MGDKKTRRSKPYLIDIGGARCRVTAAEWGRLRQAGFISPAWIEAEQRFSQRLAHLCRGVVAQIVEGRLCLQNLLSKAEAWIFTSWYLIKEGGVLSGGELQWEIQRQYGPPEVIA